MALAAAAALAQMHLEEAKRETKQSLFPGCNVAAHTTVQNRESSVLSTAVVPLATLVDVG